MNSLMKSILVITFLAASSGSVLSAQPGVRPVAGSRKDRALTAMIDSRQTYLAAREMRVDLAFPSGKTGKAILFELFEPSSGYYLQTFGWAEKDYPAVSDSGSEGEEPRWRVGVTPDRLVMITLACNAIGITESTEKAANIDDAEAKTLGWVSDHLAEIEARTNHPRQTLIGLGRWDFPQGFFKVQDDPRPCPVSLKFLSMVRRDNGWDLMFESTETQRKARLLLTRIATGWARGPVRVDAEQEKKQ